MELELLLLFLWRKQGAGRAPARAHAGARNRQVRPEIILGSIKSRFAAGNVGRNFIVTFPDVRQFPVKSGTRRQVPDSSDF
ncbi:MAG: hypothetical protein HYW49_12020 [Deltaproteobacteria bacterium]|nr:hypothetical protein [Deltaproteobacteria bacterium]